MLKKRNVSRETRNNWVIDFFVFSGAIVASLTGIYFLFLPVGGYQGGRNPMYGVQILFDRSTWDDLHTWGGILMVAAAAIHIAIHWKWIVTMTKRMLGELFSRSSHLNSRSKLNAYLNASVGVGFILAALSGVYLLYFPMGAHGVADPNFLFGRATWDLIHTWFGIVMIVAAVAHFFIHWRWVVNVTSKVVIAAMPSRQG